MNNYKLDFEDDIKNKIDYTKIEEEVSIILEFIESIGLDVGDINPTTLLMNRLEKINDDNTFIDILKHVIISYYISQEQSQENIIKLCENFKLNCEPGSLGKLVDSPLYYRKE